jgi:hypothetical protein
MRKSKETVPKSKWAALAAADGTFDFAALTDRKKEEFYISCDSIGGDENGSALTPAQRRLHERLLRGRLRKDQETQGATAQRPDACASRRSETSRRRTASANGSNE